MSLDETFTILLVEDDDNDAILLQRALTKSGVNNPLIRLNDGMEALQYFTAEGQYADREKYPFPRVVILDLKMPRLSGMELLEYLNERKDLRVIPTIVLSSSRLGSDIEKAYSLGVNTYFVKPADFDTLARMIKTLMEYWSMGEKPNPKTLNKLSQ